MAEASVCWPCVCGLHEECYEPSDLDNGLSKCCCVLGEPIDLDSENQNGVGRPVADPTEIRDILSTGRRRAQMLYPIMSNMVCEWAGLKFAGGGVYPIVGCRGNIINPTKKGATAGHRHHGPNKNVIDNSPLNVHRICATCHVRWHTLNNPTYPGERPPVDQPWYPEGEWKKHDPDTQATEEDFQEAEEFWSKKPLDRVDVEDS